MVETAAITLNFTDDLVAAAQQVYLMMLHNIALN